jgi:hypothetical protein
MADAHGSVRKPGAMVRTTIPVAGVARSYGGGVSMAAMGSTNSASMDGLNRDAFSQIVSARSA